MIRNKKAFSLIELAIVLIIIGLIVAGVTGGQVLIKKSRISGSRLLTKGSVVPTIEDLVLWLEPSMEGAILDASDNKITTDGTAVATWRNKVGWGGYLPSAAQGTSGNRPLYVKEGINKLPTIQFDGADDFLAVGFKESLPTGTDEFTVFVVASKISGSNQSVYSWASNQQRFILSTTNYYFIGLGTTFSVTSPAVSFLRPFIATWKFDGSSAYGFIDGSATTPASVPIGSPTIVRSNSFAIGANDNGAGYPFRGYVSEIIMYNRALTTDEIKDVEDYLKQKYKI